MSLLEPLDEPLIVAYIVVGDDYILDTSYYCFKMAK